MNENFIWLNYSPFQMESTATIVYKNNKQEQVKVPSEITKLVETIVQLAYNSSAYSLRITSSEELYNEIANKIHQAEQSQYSRQQIRIGRM